MSFKNYFKYRLSTFLRQKGKWAFQFYLNDNAKILDVGCGCATVIGTKSLLPNSTYFGIDISDYGQNNRSKLLMDKYILTSSKKFAETILNINEEFDAVISSHNLEHCEYPNKVLKAMINKVKKKGKIFISFPARESINFPNRIGLNYFSDKTHNLVPPNGDEIIRELRKNNFDISFYTKRYRPVFFLILGLLNEPISFINKINMKGTWELYGLETIIHAIKR